MTTYVYIATSIDGFIATEDGGIKWLYDIPNPDQSDYGYADFVSNIDCHVMGRKTFEKVLTFDSWGYEKPVFVLSNSLIQVPKKYNNKVKIMSGSPTTIIRKLAEQGYQNIYIDGGKVIQHFLRDDAVDEMIISKIPIVLGSGIRLFESTSQSLKFKHRATEVYNGEIVKSHYVRANQS
ncbi:dihydrofolate reductase family protein [Candidatus Uabimicrobium sp. HlEnr_7]|uniref:dihydrofolate reductase family protein n=1 Tax=Candidatus Uabimicrobium helgolandensis TaxID=3095367 RepID=UPI003558E0B2